MGNMWSNRGIKSVQEKNKEKEQNKPKPSKSAPKKSSSPKRPEYESIRNEEGGLKDAYSLSPEKMGAPEQYTSGSVTANTMDDPTKVGTLGANEKSSFNLNDDYLKAARDEGLRDADTASKWRNLQQTKINRAAGDAQANVQGRQRQAMDRMAMRGGRSGGASERMASAGVRDSLAAAQQAHGMGLDADIADENKRMQALRDLGGVEMGLAQGNLQSDQFNIGNQLQSERFDIGNQMSTNQFNVGAQNAANQFNVGAENQASMFNIGNQMSTDQFNTSTQNAANQFNIGNQLNDVRNQGMFDMGLYSEQMKEKAAKATAAAMPKNNGGKK